MVTIEEEEEEVKQVTKKGSSITSTDGSAMKSEDPKSLDVGEDAEEEEGWETASEGRDDEEESSEGADASEAIGKDVASDRALASETIAEGVKDIRIDGGSESTETETSTSTEAEESKNKLPQADVEEVRKQGIDAANAAKAQGNAFFGEGKFVEALQAYERGLIACPLKEPDDDLAVKEIRSILYANRGACHIGMEKYELAVLECTNALNLNPQYLKALLRRAQAREKLTNYEEAIADLNKVVELDPGNFKARASLRTLIPIAEEKREKLKAEMLGKLKEAGNSILGRFGMSVDNFKTVQDPATGSYSIQFQR